jgi:hypothetical protein
MDLAGQNVEADPVEGADGGKGLDDPFDAQRGLDNMGFIS